MPLFVFHSKPSENALFDFLSYVARATLCEQPSCYLVIARRIIIVMTARSSQIL